MRIHDRYAPSIRGPRLHWTSEAGFLWFVVRSCWRFFVTGREIFGAGDNATFLRDATRDYRDGPIERLSRARWRRIAWRWGLLGVPWLIADMWVVAAFAAYRGSTAWWAHFPWLWVLVGYLIAGFSAAAAWTAYLVRLWLSLREVRRTYIYPAHRVLAKITGVRFRRREALASIALPRGYGDEVDEELRPVRVFMPYDVMLDAGTKKRVTELVGTRLGLPEAQGKWTEAGVERAYVDLYPQPLPPERVSLDDLMDELLASPLDEPVVGMTSGRVLVHMDFRNDSPHTLGSAGSGAGKSTLYKFIAMQRLRHGAYAIILDFKKWSHLRWAGRLPAGRVLIEDEIPRIHTVLCKVLDDLLWRKSFDLDQEDELATLPTVDVYVEEINTLMGMLKTYWEAYVAEQKQVARTAVRLAKQAEDEIAMEEAEEQYARAMGLPKTSPAIQALRYGVNLGREFKWHFHFIGQSMSATAAGGRDTRESFRTRLMARWDRKTWKMLADGVDFIACPSGSVGIWAHVHGAEVEIVRVPYVPDEQAVAYVQGGHVPTLPMFHGEPMLVDMSRPAISSALPLSALVDVLPPKADGSSMTLKALQRARERRAETGFPEPIPGEYAHGQALLFNVDEVLAWFRDRERLAVEA